MYKTSIPHHQIKNFFGKYKECIDMCVEAYQQMIGTGTASYYILLRYQQKLSQYPRRYLNSFNIALKDYLCIFHKEWFKKSLVYVLSCKHFDEDDKQDFREIHTFIQEAF